LLLFAWLGPSRHFSCLPNLCSSGIEKLSYVLAKAVEDKKSFQQSEWFQRGWTLQELLAPRTVVFVTETWEVIGNRGASSSEYSGSATRLGLEGDIATVTGIPEEILHNYQTSARLSVDQKLKRIEGRKTSREEDMSYALYGIVGVTPGANYREGHQGARQRLMAAIGHRDNVAVQQAEHYRKIANWLSSPDPWTNYESARQRHEPAATQSVPGVGVWFDKVALGVWKGWMRKDHPLLYGHRGHPDALPEGNQHRTCDLLLLFLGQLQADVSEPHRFPSCTARQEGARSVDDSPSV